MTHPSDETERNPLRASGSGCPYAAALVAVNDSSDEEASQSTGGDFIGSHDAASAALKSCPAFQNGSCPFKDHTDAESVRRTLLQIPPSHLDKSGKFFKVIQQLHTIDNNDKGDYHLEGGCPVAHVAVKTGAMPAEILEHADNIAVTFTEAMEGCSLASIMAKMVTKVMDDDNKNEGEEESEKSHDDPSSMANEIPSNKVITERKRSENAPLLSESFRMGTVESHQAAEDVHFVRNFIRGEIDRELYKQLVVQLYHVYAVLEDCLLHSAVDSKKDENDSTGHYCLKSFLPFHEKLQRKETLIEDLDFWFGSKEAERIIEAGVRSLEKHHELDGIQSQACRDYVERILYIAEQDPILLLAHSYTRYLGDLSGGKILARVARRALDLGKDGDGLAFYHFEKIKSAKKFKDDYRQALDKLPLSSKQVSKLVTEANVAFLLNMRLFEELDVQAGVPGAKVRLLEEALSFGKDGAVVKTAHDAAAECPFANTSSTGTNSYSKTSFTKIKKADECPFSKIATDGSTSNKASATSTIKQGRCPWPFVFAHDPVQGLRDWQTWLVIGCLLSYCWSKFIQQ